MPARDQAILGRLRGGGWVSGAELARDLGVSRAAVGKRIGGLRRRGFTIDALPRRGYRLTGLPDRLLPEVIGPQLRTARFGRALRHLMACDSTSDEAAAWARAGAPEGATVVAEEQRRGRGRVGRTWFSPPGENLYVSVVLRPPLAPHLVAPLTLGAGVAVADALAEAGFAPELKWPNDVLLGGRKVAGILMEMSSEMERVHYVVVGIGVNVNGRRFPRALARRATSLRLARGAAAPPLDRAALLAALLGRLEAWYDRLVAEGAGPVIAAFRARAGWLGRRVRVRLGDAEVAGIAAGVEEDGALRLAADDGRRLRIVSGEVLLWD